METLQLSETKWEVLTHQLGQEFASRAIEHDKKGNFVFENYKQLKVHRYFSAMIPKELGGGGVARGGQPLLFHPRRLVNEQAGGINIGRVEER